MANPLVFEIVLTDKGSPGSSSSQSAQPKSAAPATARDPLGKAPNTEFPGAKGSGTSDGPKLSSMENLERAQKLKYNDRTGKIGQGKIPSLKSPGAQASVGRGLGMLGKIGVAGAVIAGVAKAAESAFATTGAMVRGTVTNAQTIAKGTGLQAFDAQVNSSAEALSKIPIAGKVAAEALRSLGSTLTAFPKLISGFADRGRQLADYSPEIAQAQAMAEVAKMRRDIEEAGRLGSRYSGMIEKEAEFEQKMAEVMLEVKEAVMSALEKVDMDKLGDMLGTFLELSIPVMEFTLGFMNGVLEALSALLSVFNKSLDIQKKAAETKPEGDELKASLDKFLKAMDRGVGIPLPDRPGNNEIGLGFDILP